MANEYFTASGYPATRAQGSSAALRAQLAAIDSAFDKLPALTGNGGKVLGVNAGGTGIEALSAINGIPVGSVSPASGAFTTLATNAGLTVSAGGVDLTGVANLRGDGSGVAAFTAVGTAFRQKGSAGTMYFDVGSDGSSGSFQWRSSSTFIPRMTLDSLGDLHLARNFLASSSGYEYTSVSQMISSADSLFGGGVAAGTVGGTFIKMTDDSAACISMQITDGISFHSGFTGAAGTAFARTAKRRMQLLHDGRLLLFAPDSGTALNVAGAISATDYIGITSAHIASALGFTPYSSANPSGFITGITGPMVTTALGFTPYSAANPSGYITGITSGMVTGALGFTPYSSANPSGYLSSINSAQVTTALGFTPYSNANPSGFISGITSGMVTTALGYTPPTLTGSGANGTWGISVTGNAGSATALQTARNINSVAFSGAADITITADSPTSMYGEYTPTITAGANMGSTTPGTCYWHRRGNYVTVDGYLLLQPTTASGLTSAQFTLPVASNLAAGSEGNGVAICTVSFDPGNVTGNTTTDKAEIFFNSTYSGSTRQWNFKFTYKVQ